MLTWVSVLTITVLTALFTVGIAPHNVWLRVLWMPAPAILYCFGGVLFLITLYSYMGCHHFELAQRPEKKRYKCISNHRGGSYANSPTKVLPGVYYFIEDIVAVNAGGGRPYGEALVARYKASPRFRRMIHMQSWFWSIPALNLAIPLTTISVIPQVPATVAYGVAWIVPFLWATIWGIITIQWCKRDIARERREWEAAI